MSGDDGNLEVTRILTSRPVTVHDDVTVSEAVRLLERHGIRHLPVLRAGRLVGVVSERDLLEPAGKLAARADEEGELEPLLVRHVMGGGLLTLPPEATVAEAAELLVEWGVSCVPVVRGSSVVGLVTTTDLLSALVRASRDARPGLEDPTLGEVMTVAPVSATTRTTLAEARHAMVEGDFRHLPVLTPDGRPVALVSDRDLLRAAGNGLGPTAWVSQLALDPPAKAPPTELVSRAAHRMAHDRLDALCVVDDDDLLAGVFTATDALAHEARLVQSRRPQSPR